MRRAAGPWLLVLAPALVPALIAGAITGCGGGGSEPGAQTPAAVARPTNVLLVSFDTLRADRLGCYGHAAARTPHLDALAARGARFTQATTVTPLTLPAHSSLLTGTFPAYHGVRDNGGFYLAESQRTLAETLAAAGYRTGGFVGAFVLDARWGIAQGFERFFDDFDLTRFEDAAGMDAIQRRGDAVVDQALEWLAASDERPFFAWVHLYDPHAPYDAPEPFRGRFPAGPGGAYDAEIAFADHQLGRLLAALTARGALAQTLVVAVSDHGEMLGDHGEITHGFFVYDAAVRIPMILAGPGIEPRVIDDQVRIVDLMPTILGRLGIAAPAAVQGADLAALLAGGRQRLLALSESWFPRRHYGWSELTSIQDGRYKMIRAPRPELYDLEADPAELDDLAGRDPARLAAMRATLERMLEALAAPAAESAQPAPVDEETRARLEALGYLGGGRARNLEDGAARADPKDKIQLYNRLKEVGALSIAGQLEPAAALARRVLAEDPDIVEAWVLLGNTLKKAGELAAAADAYSAALARDPEYGEALFDLAVTYKDQGRLDDALAGLERASALDPRNGKVLWQRADVLMRQRRFEDAAAVLEGALGLELDRPRFLLKLGACYLEMGRFDDAESQLRAALAENPALEAAQFTRGLVAEAAGRPAEAIAAYRAELRHNAGAYRASFNLAKLLLGAGMPREAVTELRRTVEIQPAFGTGHLYLAKALLDAGDLEAAARAAETGLANDPEPAIAPLGHFVLADVYSRQGRTAEAERAAATGRRLQAAAAGG